MNTVRTSDVAFGVKEIIADKLGLDQSVIMENARFSDDLGVDSLDLVELFTDLEKEFHINIPDEDAEKLTSAGAVIRYIKEHAR